jgi:hypothetical protein
LFVSIAAAPGPPQVNDKQDLAKACSAVREWLRRLMNDPRCLAGYCNMLCASLRRKLLWADHGGRPPDAAALDEIVLQVHQQRVMSCSR